MKAVDIRDGIRNSVSAVRPLDDIERQHIDFVLNWIQSGVEIFRTEKPATPPIHLVSYFLVFSPEESKVLLVDHKKAELWLPSGAHVEPGEDPKETVIREAKEELGIEADFLFEEPLFLTVTQTVGNITQHTDVSLWYVLKSHSDDPMTYDKDEFHQIRWFGIDEIPFERSDPHLKRFIEKMIFQFRSHINWKAYESSAVSYAEKVESLHSYTVAEKFLSMISPNGKIIDIGCGSGRDAKVFSEKGFVVTGIDFSSKMIEVAKEKAPQADFHVMDMRSLNFDLIFDGAWANASLLHLSKNEFSRVLKSIYKSLKFNGLFYIKLKKGSSEGLELDSRYNNLEKFYSYYDEQEMRELLLAAGFTVLDLFVTENESSYQTHPYIHAFCRKQYQL